ncbi:hypothetical protein ACFL3G_12065 [Planctomycetota bacterium]
MPRITEKLDFMTGHAVKVYAKACIGRKAGHKNRGFVQIFNETVPEKKILDYSR